MSQYCKVTGSIVICRRTVNTQEFPISTISVDFGDHVLMMMYIQLLMLWTTVIDNNHKPVTQNFTFSVQISLFYEELDLPGTMIKLILQHCQGKSAMYKCNMVMTISAYCIDLHSRTAADNWPRDLTVLWCNLAVKITSDFHGKRRHPNQSNLLQIRPYLWANK